MFFLRYCSKKNQSKIQTCIMPKNNELKKNNINLASKLSKYVGPAAPDY